MSPRVGHRATAYAIRVRLAYDGSEGRNEIDVAGPRDTRCAHVEPAAAPFQVLSKPARKAGDSVTFVAGPHVNPNPATYHSRIYGYPADFSHLYRLRNWCSGLYRVRYVYVPYGGDGDITVARTAFRVLRW